MRVLLQRVSRAEVRIGGTLTGRIAGGLLLFVGFQRDEDPAAVEWMAEKVLGLRIFADDAERMNRSLLDTGGDVLVVSQFTLYGDARKGRRPSFVHAAEAPEAVPLYERFVAALRERAPAAVETGEFGTMMEVELVNDGPVTLMLER